MSDKGLGLAEIRAEGLRKKREERKVLMEKMPKNLEETKISEKSSFQEAHREAPREPKKIKYEVDLGASTATTTKEVKKIKYRDTGRMHCVPIRLQYERLSSRANTAFQRKIVTFLIFFSEH